jgi:hypothetical protein
MRRWTYHVSLVTPASLADALIDPLQDQVAQLTLRLFSLLAADEEAALCRVVPFVIRSA